jgi:hypothetical protein
MFLLLGLLFLVLEGGMANPVAAQLSGRTSSAPVGASMALLATLQDAGVLPHEGTPEANHVIQVVIQFQSVFMKSSDEAVRTFRDHALAERWAERAEEIGSGFRSKGWTSEVLEAFVDHYSTLPPDQRSRLNDAFAQFNMRQADFEFLAQLFDRARTTFRKQGQNIHEVFTARRSTMPGRDRPNRKEQPNGDQSLYSDQGQGRTNERRPAIPQEAYGG